MEKSRRSATSASSWTRAIVGANGAGKSSLMKCIAGLLKPQWGEVYLNDRKMEPAAYKVVEQGVCLVPEGRWIFPNLTVEENLMLGGYTSKNRAAGIERAYGMFPRLEERRKQRAGTMSGGEQQMLAIARGLMANPKVLHLDDPRAAGGAERPQGPVYRPPRLRAGAGTDHQDGNRGGAGRR